MTTTADPTTTAFLAAIDDDPRDRQRWLVYADYLEDRGEPEAEGWRWLVRRRKIVGGPAKYGGGWWWLWPESRSIGSYKNTLPENVGYRLADGNRGEALSTRWREYSTASAALADAARAVVKWKKGKVK